MSGFATWGAPTEHVEASGGEVHVWRVRLDAVPASEDCLTRSLSGDELARADRFVFERDRSSYRVVRGTLRAILGEYLGIPAHALEFTYNAYGKPALASARRGGDLRFNVSRTDGMALIAVACGREIGIDVERYREADGSDDTNEVARRFFAPPEVAAILALPAGQQPRAFFTCWTRKEAYVKARGEGLSVPLSRFVVSVAPTGPAALLSTTHGARELERWSLLDLEPGSDYAAALAAEGHGWRARFWEWRQG